MPEKTKPTNGKTEMPPNVTQKKPGPKGPRIQDRSLHVDLWSLAPSLDLLNSLMVFEGKIKFLWIRRRGVVIQAGFASGRMAQWSSATDLRMFPRSQDILLEATGFLMHSPTKRTEKEVWEPVAQLIRNISNLDATDLPPALPEEFEQFIRSTWIKSRSTTWKGIVNDPEEWYFILEECQREYRDPKAQRPARSCVWAGGAGESAPQFCWVYLEGLLDWLSTPKAKNRTYGWDEARKALLMLDFTPVRLHRSYEGKGVSVRVWRGPIDILVDDETVPVTPIC